jgi:hypothetical protein
MEGKFLKRILEIAKRRATPSGQPSVVPSSESLSQP